MSEINQYVPWSVFVSLCYSSVYPSGQSSVKREEVLVIFICSSVAVFPKKLWVVQSGWVRGRAVVGADHLSGPHLRLPFLPGFVRTQGAPGR